MNAPIPATAFNVANIGAGKSRMDLSKQWISRPADQRFLNLDDLRAYIVDHLERVDLRKVDKFEFVDVLVNGGES